MRGWATALLLSCLLSSLLVAARAQAVESATAGKTVRVAASERYKANRIHRFTFGGGYRDLWEAEIERPCSGS